MAEHDGASEGRIRSYLAHQGGSVADPGGRGLTDEMARALGIDKPAALSAVLGQMESDGVITREMRGLRTFRIALVTADAPVSVAVAAAVDSAPAAVDNGADGTSARRRGRMVSLRESIAGEPAPVEVPPPSGTGAVSLREALSRRSPARPPAAVPAAPGAAPAAVAGTAPAAVVEATNEASDQRTGKAVSLREALSTRPATAVTAPPVGEAPDEAWAPARAGRFGAEPVARTANDADVPYERPAGRAVSLRQALAEPDDTAVAPSVGYRAEPEAWSPAGSGGQFASLRDAGRLPPVPDAGPAFETTDKRSSKRAARGTGTARTRRTRPKLGVPVPEVNTPPSSTIVTAVGIAVAGLVLLAIVTVVVAKGSTHHVGPLGGINPSNDACNIVTSDLATAAFGDNAGQPHFVVGDCVYDDGTHELIVEVYHQSARQVFDASRSSSAVDVPGIGDEAYYVDGRLRVLKGSSLIEITLGPVPASSPSPSLLALANAAVARL